ncbi:MAG TPA: LPS export ABC transporter periplasmic protein LptC [Gammaproteobacteria bacterium]|nr:LPS export ABC transporter periplasmic protein LptC [Gammaproteobacteria bacterium]
MRVSGLVRLFLTALGCVALFIGLTEPTNKTSVDQTLKEITDQRPDAFMQGINQRKFDRHGRLETTLTATSLLDFGSRANAKLINPKLRLERQHATWFIEGERGELTPDRNEVFLSKNVIADRLENGKNSWHLSGETLKWDQRTDLVTSTTRTTLSQGSIDSVGNELVINLNTNEYRLGDNVRTKWRSATSSD